MSRPVLSGRAHRLRGGLLFPATALLLTLGLTVLAAGAAHAQGANDHENAAQRVRNLLNGIFNGDPVLAQIPKAFPPLIIVVCVIILVGGLFGLYELRVTTMMFLVAVMAAVWYAFFRPPGP